MKKALAGVITYLIGLTLLLIVVVEAVAKIILFIMLGSMSLFLLFGLYWLILQLLEDDPNGVIAKAVRSELKPKGKKSASRTSF